MYNNKDVIKKLKESGFKVASFPKDGYIEVKKSTAVKVNVRVSDDDIAIKTRLPQLGNDIQVISTIVLIPSLIYLDSFYPNGILPVNPIILAVIFGLSISYLWYLPKVNKLKKEVELLFDK